MKEGYFGVYGGMFVPETLVAPLTELQEAYKFYFSDESFLAEYKYYLHHYIGRPTPLTFAQNLTEFFKGAKIYLKREDLAHTGAHKINNALGQALLAQKMGKKRIIAETGAGQHGVATATVCALLKLKCTIYMGKVDMKRQALNVSRMKMLGAQVKAVDKGTCTLKEAVSEAMRDWVLNIDSYYLLGSVLGPHPYPSMIRDLQCVIGEEAKKQIQEAEHKLPNKLIASVGGGSNAIGLFYPFLNDLNVQMTGVEAQGKGGRSKKHAARLNGGSPGVFQGTKSYVLQDKFGRIQKTHSISAGLDYPAIGPEHANLYETKRVNYVSATDKEALMAGLLLSRHEGIIPALESAHALAYLNKIAGQMSEEEIVIVNVSGRGDKDMQTYAKNLRESYENSHVI